MLCVIILLFFLFPAITLMFCLRPVCVPLSQYLTAPMWIQFFCCCIFFLVYKCLSVPSTRRPHHLASIHHSPPTSHPSRSYCSIRHPRLRTHSHWQQRYSTTPHISTTPSACYILSLLLLLMSYSSVLLLYCFELQHPSLMWTQWDRETLRMGKISTIMPSWDNISACLLILCFVCVFSLRTLFRFF